MELEHENHLPRPMSRAQYLEKHNGITMNPEMIQDLNTMSPHKQAAHAERVNFAKLKADRLETLNKRRAANGLPPK